MTDLPAAAVAALAPPPALEPDAIGVAQDTVIGMASAAPGVSVGLTLAALAAATACGSGPVLLITAVPMLVIANAYRRLNLWNATCGASFEWVGRAISPYLGFMTGWLMIAAYITGAVAGVEVIGPSVLAVAGVTAPGPWPDIWIATGITAVMLAVAVAGIKITARVQVSMAVAEYVILAAVAVAGLVAVFGHWRGTFPVTAGWLSPSGIGGKGSLASGLLIAVFIYSGWEGTLYVNEEVRHRRVNPGKAAIWAVALLTVLYALAVTGLQGIVSPARLQGHSASALVYVAGALGGPAVARLAALALALSVIAATGTSIVLCARIIYGMASRHTLPPALARVSPRFATPVQASIATGVLLITATWAYLLANQHPGRLRRRDQRLGAAVRRVLHPHRPGRRHLPPPPHHRQPPRRHHPGHPARRRRVPGLDHHRVHAHRTRTAELVPGRNHRRRP
ncbi:MAG TPA: APC family permease, partial [Streptosporangiaceae bacterium]